jgi:ankyrin repeat protein
MQLYICCHSHSSSCITAMSQQVVPGVPLIAARNVAGETPLLRAAAARDSLSIVRLLLEIGSDPFAVDGNQVCSSSVTYEHNPSSAISSSNSCDCGRILSIYSSRSRHFMLLIIITAFKIVKSVTCSHWCSQYKHAVLRSIVNM